MNQVDLSHLSPEQRKVVDTWGMGLAVEAGAGSGKTTTLVVKCGELLRRNPEAKFAAVSFTERSASDLREKLSSMLDLAPSGGTLGGHWVMTIHGLCSSVIREYPREAGFDGEETMLSEPEAILLWERAIDGIWVEELPAEVQDALERLLTRETRDAVIDLLARVRAVEGFGALKGLARLGESSVFAQALHRLGSYVLERYERLKRRRGVLDFNDLEAGADRALDHENVRRSFQGRFDLLLVDEFQDTNPVQARIVWRLARPDASNLCVVGDPKQSIYRFRDADVTVFAERCASLPCRLSLTWNFRSRPGVIEFVNEVCARSFSGSGVAFEPLVARRDEPDDAEVRAHPVLRIDVETPEDLAHWIIGERTRGVPLHDMALLLRKIRGNEKWLKALTTAGIPVAIGSGGLFWEDPRVRELTAFLKWWDNPGNALSGAIFLRAPWVGVPDRELDAWIKKDPTWADSFFKSENPIAEVLAPFRGQAVRPGELLMALLIDQAREEELGAPLLGLWHRAEELSGRGLGFHEVIVELARGMAERRRERDVPPPKNLGQLMVLTIHGSKGLEFPHVILLDFPAKLPRAGMMPMLFWDRAKGAFLGGRTEDGDRDRKDPIEKQWRDDERFKELAESKRLFYVALTRARERLILVFPPEGEKPARLKPEEVYDKDFWRGWIEQGAVERRPTLVSSLPGLAPSVRLPLNRRPDRASHETELQLEDAQVRLPHQHRPRHSVTEWNTLARCPRAYEWSFIRPVATAVHLALTSLLTDQVAGQEMAQNELGSRVHECLERGDYDGLRELEKTVGAHRFQAEPLVSWALSSGLMAPADLAAGREVWPELAFEVPLGHEVLVGSIDRLVCQSTPQGIRYHLIDYKVTGKPKSVESLHEAYGTQLKLYAWALGRLEAESVVRTEALLVNISSSTIQAVPLPLDPVADAQMVERLAREASKIVEGQAGEPKTGMLCKVCEFREKCAEGKRYLASHP